MKRHTTILLCVMASIAVTQAEESSLNSCLTMLEMMKENAIAAGNQEAAEDVNLDIFADDWAKMTEEEREEADKECAEVIELMKQEQNMG